MRSRLFCRLSRYIFARDFGGAVERGCDGAELGDEVDGAFVADAGRAGNVVDGIAFEGEQVGHLATAPRP